MLRIWYSDALLLSPSKRNRQFFNARLLLDLHITATLFYDSNSIKAQTSISYTITAMAHHRALVRPVREVVYRCRPQTCSQIRYNSTDQKVNNVPPVNQEGVKSGPNESQLPHVTEEQAAMDKSMGQTPPDIGQGTPVQDVRLKPQALTYSRLTSSR